MTFDEWKKEAAEKKEAFDKASEELRRTGTALEAFYKDTLGVDANGTISIDAVSTLVGKIVDMKGGNAQG